MLEQLFAHPEVLVQGITGKHGSFHTKEMLAAGTHITCGVTPGQGGEQTHGVPVYSSVVEALQHHPASISIIFVPAPFAKKAIFEALDAGIKYIICITEGVPVHDMLVILAKAQECGAQILGPNCPGLLVPGVIKLGIIPASLGTPGNTAIVSRSGTLTYEAAASLTAAGIGQRYIVGIGGDRLRGVSFIDCLAAFEKDPLVKQIVLIGEIGGTDELLAANYIQTHVSKPVFAYIVGHSAPAETQLGHAGAILGSHDESATAKTAVLTDAGAITSNSLAGLIKKITQN